MGIGKRKASKEATAATGHNRPPKARLFLLDKYFSKLQLFACKF